MNCARCGAPIVCTLCEACPEHCRLKDPIACAREAVEWGEKNLGADDPRTKTAREQLEEARLNLRAKDAAERARAAVLGSRRRDGRGPKPRGRPN
jgi:hypothetical protein